MKKGIKGNIEFKEEQRFRRPLLWLFAMFPLLITIGFIIAVGANTLGEGYDGLIGLVFVIPVNLIVIYFAIITKFEMMVTDEGVYYRWRPFNRQYNMISKPEISEVRLRKSPFLKFGYNKRVIGYGRVHNMGAARGLQFILKSGRKIFISSEKINGFQRAVEKLAPVSLK